MMRTKTLIQLRELKEEDEEDAVNTLIQPRELEEEEEEDDDADKHAHPAKGVER
jgi:hypothetical protein